MSRNIVEVIGFDLGHGETAVAKAPMGKDTEPQMVLIHGKETQVTAIARHPKTKGVVIGTIATTLPNVEKLEICFKTPLLDSESRKTISAYFDACYKYLVENNKIRGGDENFFVVGCPSGWKKSKLSNSTLLEEYQALLNSTSVVCLKVVPESRAAFMQAKEGGTVTIDELKSTVVVIDIGSLTTDVTRVRGTTSLKPFDFGVELGASIIDKGIFNHSLSISRDREVFEDLFSERPDIKTKCELKCREAKENFFNTPEELLNDPNFTIIEIQDIQNIYNFRAIVNENILNGILNKPISTLTDSSTIGGSWLEIFKQILIDTRDELEKEGTLPKVIIFTGGASRMRFVPKIARVVFPEEEVHIEVDAAPSLAIAKGLAYVGRWDLRTRKFIEEVDHLCNDKIPLIVSSYEDDLVDNLVSVLSENLMEKAVKQGMNDWVKGEVDTLNKLNLHMEVLTERWVNSEDGIHEIFEATNSWFRPILDDIKTHSNRICKKFFLEQSALTPNPNLSFEDFKVGMSLGEDIEFVGSIGTMIGLVTAGITASILGGGGMALLWSGPIGWIVGFLIALPFGAFLSDKTEDWIKNEVLYLWFREKALPPHKIIEKCGNEDMRDKLKDGIKEQILRDKQSIEKMVKKLSNQLQKELHDKANEVRILIP